MLTQAIKRWLHRLFAWWPWKRSPETNYTQVSGTLNMSATQEAAFRTTVDGSVAQPGITSVVVEQTGSETLSETPRPSPAEASDKMIYSDAEKPSSTSEQRLEFLQYLVRRGIVNEGFEQGKVPEQYRL
jgi:hypothetical protein